MIITHNLIIMRRQKKTNNNTVNYNILDNINENAPQSHFDTLEVNTPPKPQKHAIQSHRAIQRT